MSYCINPNCLNRQNPDPWEYCQGCNTPLLINQRYRLVKPLRPLNEEYYSEIFEVEDCASFDAPNLATAPLSGVATLTRGYISRERGQRKILKSLRINRAKVVELFEQEVKLLSHLSHSGIPKVEPNGFFTLLLSNGQQLRCLVMEKIKGWNLEQWMEENENEPISQELALQWLKQLAEILEYVHQNRFFHRDIKPSNIILKPNGQLVLIDFGTAREITETVINGRTITVVYSHGYTAPEQFEGRAIPQSDFFALGRTLVYLLTGQHPNCFSIDSETGQLMWRDSAGQVSKPLADFIDRLMERSHRKRPQDAREILRVTEPIILHTTLQQLKEIGSLTQPLDEKLEQSNSTIPVVPQAESLPCSMLSPEQYSRVEGILMKLIGPIAPTLLQQVGGQVLSLKELVEKLLPFLALHQQVELEKEVMLLVQQTTVQSQAKSAHSTSAKKPTISENFVSRCERELANLIGPVATFLIQDTLKSSPQMSPVELVKALAAEIPDLQKACDFQQRLAS